MSSLLLVGCPDEQKPEIGAADAGLAPISPVTSTKTATVGAIDPPVKHNVVKPPPSRTCADAPKWVSQPPCLKDGFLYGSGEFHSKAETYLARSTAANRARKRLALALGAHENDSFKLASSEIDQIFHCEGAVHALARVPHRGKGEFRKCTDESLAAPPAPSGCPNWTRRMAWKEGDLLYGVAPAFRVMQRHQADTAAANRARQAVAEMVEVELQLSPDGVTSTVLPTPLMEQRRSTADCDGTRWMMVAFAKGATDERLLRSFNKTSPDRLKMKSPTRP